MKSSCRSALGVFSLRFVAKRCAVFLGGGDLCWPQNCRWCVPWCVGRVGVGAQWHGSLRRVCVGMWEPAKKAYWRLASGQGALTLRAPRGADAGGGVFVFTGPAALLFCVPSGARVRASKKAHLGLRFFQFFSI